MNKQPRAIVLGGTSPHISLIERLQKRGYFTILLDYYENPPAKAAADKHIQESTLDEEKVLTVAKEEAADLVISACVDQANVTACYVGEKLGLPIPYSYRTALEVTDKGLMKEKMVKNRIPTARHFYLNRESAIGDMDLTYPVMVKPADACGSAGVKKVLHPEELQGHLENALTVSRGNKAVVEEYKEGTEISIYSFIKNKKTHIVMATERFSITDGPEEVLKCYATLAPATLTKATEEKLITIIDKIVESFGIDNTALHVQAFIDGEDINIIEFAPRVGGGVSYQTILQNTGFDIIEATIDSYLGNEVSLDYTLPKEYYAVNIIYGHPGVFDHIVGQQQLLEDKVIEEFFQYKSPGMAIGSDKASSGRVGSFIVKARSKEELLEKTRIAMETFEVYDAKQTPLMRKDLFLQDL